MCVRQALFGWVISAVGSGFDVNSQQYKLNKVYLNRTIHKQGYVLTDDRKSVTRGL